METRKFKTTAKCQGCVAKIKPFLNELMPEELWSFDMSGKEKILIVQGDCPEEMILKALQEAGFQGEQIG